MRIVPHASRLAARHYGSFDMSKKSAKNATQGTYALCISAGAMVGLGIGPLMGSVPLTALAGAALGAVAGYLFTRHKGRKRQH